MTLQSLTIFDLCPADVDEVLQLEQRTPGAPHWRRSAYDKLFDATSLLSRRGVVVRMDGAVVGFAIANVLVCGSVAEAELESIAVLPDVQQKGVGRLLLSALLTRLARSGVSELRLEVRSSSVPALSFYKSCGFMTTGLRRRYYLDPEEDAVLMGLRLPGLPAE